MSISRRMDKKAVVPIHNGILLLLLLSRISCVRLCATPETEAHQALPIPGILQARTLEWVAISCSNSGIMGDLYRRSASGHRPPCPLLGTMKKEQKAQVLGLFPVSAPSATHSNAKADSLRPALSVGGQATAWEGSPGRSLFLTKSSACGRLWQFAHPRPLSLLQRGLAPRSKGTVPSLHGK